MAPRDGNEEVETELQQPPPGAPRIQAFSRLSWRDAAGAHAVVVDRPMLVGSAPKAEIVIDDPTVSRLHAELEQRDDGLWVRDLGSTNGTFVQDVRVGSALVPPGGSLRLGATSLTVRVERAASAEEIWPEPRLGAMVGGSAAMRALYAKIMKVAASDAPVLVSGETGTGKELVARAVHDSSARAASPFVIVDCGALPEPLLESELFGHARGAFTGAVSARIGAIETAQGGTVFLDEIGEMPLSMQPKLLRVLESRTVRRVGEAQHRPVDVRFVSATHRDLRAMVAAGTFREDLYFRIAVIPLRVPPLRARAEDIPMLIAQFAPAMPAAERARLATELAGRQLDGNVRELRNLVERAAVFGDVTADFTGPQHAGEPASFDALFERPFDEFHAAMEREYLQRLMQRHGGNAAAAAAAAGFNRTYVYRLLRKHGL